MGLAGRLIFVGRANCEGRQPASRSNCPVDELELGKKKSVASSKYMVFLKVELGKRVFGVRTFYEGRELCFGQYNKVSLVKSPGILVELNLRNKVCCRGGFKDPN